MTLKERFKNIKGPLNWLGLLIDIAMLFLTIINLAWLMFDAIYNMPTIQNIVDPILPFYRHIHENFYFYDGIVVSIFIAELLARWAVAIYQQKYERWFFYPFFHWYDVIGCVPTGSFRILRLFRIFSLTYRLHYWQVIDLNNYLLFNKATYYYNGAIEEISDRVLIKVLDRAKEQIQEEEPLPDEVIRKVIVPRKTELAQIIAHNIQSTLSEQYPQYSKLLKQYINQTVQAVVSNNPEIRQIERIPIIGAQLEKTLHQATSQIVFGVMDQLVKDAVEPKNEKTICVLVDSLLEIILQQQLQYSEVGNEMASEAIDLIIERLRVKDWQKEKNRS
ncbi:MAG: hypothetical protein AB8E82_11970 [Aureispira sp.]